MSPSEIQATLRRIGKHPQQSLGQNFLCDENMAKWIVDQLDIQPGEPWVEIGPGLGSLTRHAVARSENGLLIEKDDRLIAHLGEQYSHLRLAHTDAARFDVRDLYPQGPTAILGNLPYYIASQILFNWAEEPTPASRIVITLQKEMAERMCAPEGNKTYGAPTVLLGRRWKFELLRTMPARIFTPRPGVESAVVRMTPRAPGEIPECDGPKFRSLVKRGFNERRKQLRNLVGDQFTDWEATCAQLDVPVTVRGEDLSIAQWATLADISMRQTRPDAPRHAQDVNGEIFDVVDEENRVTGQATRAEVHAQKLRHRAVHIFVLNTRGELFLQRRSRHKDIHPLGWDSSAAGHVNAGSDFDATAPRELEEELGVSAPLNVVCDLPASRQTGMEFVRLYTAEHNGPFSLNPAEIDCGGFFTLDQLDRWIAARPKDFAGGFLECYRHFRQK